MEPEIVEAPKGYAFAARFVGDDFAGYSAAEAWLRERGYAVGSMERNAPIGVAPGCQFVSKWSYIQARDLKRLSGEIVPLGDFRSGGAEVRLRVWPVGLAA